MFIGADRLSNSPSRTDLLQRPNFLDGDCTTMYSKDTWNVSYCACVYINLAVLWKFGPDVGFRDLCIHCGDRLADHPDLLLGGRWKGERGGLKAKCVD